MLPSFVCAGFQKCGTTTLFDLLDAHHGIVLARDVKEPMYYRIPAVSSIGGKRYYAWRYFSHVDPSDSRLVGEVNAGLTFNGCARRMKKHFPKETKFIFMLRNPADRAWSAYKFFSALGFLPSDVTKDDIKLGHAAAFDKYCRSVLADPKQREKIMAQRMKYLCFSQGNYNTCIGEFSDYFRNIKLVLFEDFIRDQKAVCEELYQFLGVAPDDTVPYGIKANETKYAPITVGKAKYRKIVKGFDYGFDEFIAMSKWAPGVYKAYHRFNRSTFQRCTKPDEDNSKMLPQTRQLLNDYYQLEVDRLSTRMGRNLFDVWGG